jgi:hypothetical protein
MKYTNLMIDLESMGLPPTGALIGLGGCFFDLKEQTIGPTFYRAVNLATAVREGGTMTPSTVMWWLGQSQEAREAVRFSALDIRTVLTEFADFIAEHSRVQDVRTWGNANTFDLTLLSGAYERMGMKQPWHYVNEMCFRTVRNMYPQVVYDPERKGKDAHNALADAIFQANHLFAIKNRNKTHA